MGFQKVTRVKSKLRLALAGPSGSGKTLSALLLAFGITGDWSKIALIDTEHGRAKFYAERSDLGTGAFLYQEMCAPYAMEVSGRKVNSGVIRKLSECASSRRIKPAAALSPFAVSFGSPRSAE